MDALPAPAMLATGRLRLVPVVGDSMAPTLRCGDVVLASPADAFAQDGLYVLQMIPGATEVCRAQHIGGRRIRIFRDNPAYREDCVSASDFASMVLARVAATGRVVEPGLMEGIS